MPSDDYALSGGGGALKLKGARIDKKKKKKRARTDLEKNLSTTADDSDSKKLVRKEKAARQESEDGLEDEHGESVAQKTESERQHEETKKKRVSPFISTLSTFPPFYFSSFACFLRFFSTASPSQCNILMDAVTQNG